MELDCQGLGMWGGAGMSLAGGGQGLSLLVSLAGTLGSLPPGDLKSRDQVGLLFSAEI